MSKAGRLLKVGDEALTDYKKGMTLVRIVNRIQGGKCQSGILFQVTPPLTQDKNAWFDADWFDPFSTNLL